MRLYVGALGVAVTAHTWVLAQEPVVIPGQLPGTTVSSPLNLSIKRPLPAAVPSAGLPVGARPKPTDALLTSPTATLPMGSFDPSAVIGPVPASMLPRGEQTLWQKFVDEFGERLGLVSSPETPRWVPGISRRNRKRAEERLYTRWWRD